LHEVDGYEHQEIAELLDCSVGNSKSQLHKAKLRIRELLSRAHRESDTAGAAHVLRRRSPKKGTRWATQPVPTGLPSRPALLPAISQFTATSA